MTMNAGFDILINEGRIYNGIKDWKNKTAGSTVHSVQRNRDGTVKPKSCNGNITQTVGLRRNWWVVANPYTGETAGHPAPMPYSLASDHITTWTDCGEMVLDPFMGSGTTGVACAKLGRKFIGVEIEERYFDIACRRISEAQRQSDLFLSQPIGNSDLEASYQRGMFDRAITDD